jgi:Fe-S oxidoreductase
MGHEVDIVPLPELLLGHLSSDGRDTPSEDQDEGKVGPPFRGAEVSSSWDPPSSITFFDSCHDRFDTRHGTAIRALLRACLPKTSQREMEHHGKQTLCCGAGGAVASYDTDLTQRRVWRVIDEACATEADMLVTACPTCTYTIAQALLSGDFAQRISNHNYLELVFGETIDWAEVFRKLETMWMGEYGPWLSQTFFS